LLEFSMWFILCGSPAPNEGNQRFQLTIGL
jgi:hypothetical protein